ncbi:MAG: acyl-CoA dehydrogenase family protein, partial [Acidimicrobiales bacterium]
MAWDFETEPEYAAKLAWARELVDNEIVPLETLQLSPEVLVRAFRPLQDEVKRQGLWAAHLPPELGGMGFGQVRLGLLAEILGRTFLAPMVFGNNAPDSGNA